ncbi:islet amyloid polypeptide [Eleutherodactylus coqui]|uniref:islet amyloid polypeptide n=1 Tax=Eleutherodactylus coqui TaxID=57060 RepID=UPI0034629146
MRHPGLSLLCLLLLVTLSCLDAAPTDRMTRDIPNVSTEKERIPNVSNRPVLLESNRQKRSRVEKRKCNTATCVTQRLADFLVRSSNSHGPIYAPTNVGSFTYGKRDVVGLLRRESFDYLQH